MDHGIQTELQKLVGAIMQSMFQHPILIVGASIANQENEETRFLD